MSASYSSYNYNKGFRALMTFISTDLSSFYMEATKDCLYADAADGYKRRCAQVSNRAVTKHCTLQPTNFLSSLVW